MEAKEHALLLSEPAFNPRSAREKLTEISFEKLETPAMFLAKDAVLACFATGRATGLVLDSGAGKSSVVPVYDGYVLQNAMVRSNLAGDRLDAMLLTMAEKREVSVVPHYEVQRREVNGRVKVSVVRPPLTHPSYARFSLLVCFVLIPFDPISI